MTFRRNQNIYISSNIEIDCVQSLSLTTDWSILHCSFTCENQTELLRSIERTQKDIFIPARTLEDGLYQLQLTATMTDYPSLSSSSSVYIQITRSTISINLISFNALVITHDNREDLILDPGQHSFDLNRITFNEDVCV